MKKVNFDHIDRKNFTVYTACFHLCNITQDTLSLNGNYSVFRSKPKSEEEWAKLVSQTEDAFHLLVTAGNNNGYDVDTILTIPMLTGSTCFSFASKFSEKISRYILGRGIEVNTIDYLMKYPDFKFSELSIEMMLKDINPFIISDDGTSAIDQYPSGFENNDAKGILAQYSRSIHYSIENINCGDDCLANCPSKFRKFYAKNGKFLEMTEKYKIGGGGFGMVYRAKFHGKDMAMKCVPIKETQKRFLINHIIDDLENDISELTIQKTISNIGPGVIVPAAHIRQQIQEQDTNGKWIPKNFNIYIYPLFDCNLNELHKGYFDLFTEEILTDIIYQCLKRNDFCL